jgi:hypothetical protein
VVRTVLALCGSVATFDLFPYALFCPASPSGADLREGTPRAIQLRDVGFPRALDRPLHGDLAGELLRVCLEHWPDHDSEARAERNSDPGPDRVLGEGGHHYPETISRPVPKLTAKLPEFLGVRVVRLVFWLL